MTALVFAGGHLGNISKINRLLTETKLIIAADGGADHCANLDILPDILVGDLDSIKEENLNKYVNAGIEIHKYPVDKNATDLELALDLLLEKNINDVCLLGALGGRWDMSLANILLIARTAYSPLRITLLGDDCRIHILHPHRPLTIADEPGTTVSFLPIKGDVHGVNLTGFKYPLTNHTISFASTLGISNVLENEQSTVSFTGGLLLCVILNKHHPPPDPQCH